MMCFHLIIILLSFALVVNNMIEFILIHRFIEIGEVFEFVLEHHSIDTIKSIEFISFIIIELTIEKILVDVWLTGWWYLLGLDVSTFSIATKSRIAIKTLFAMGLVDCASRAASELKHNQEVKLCFFDGLFGFAKSHLNLSLGLFYVDFFSIHPFLKLLTVSFVASNWHLIWFILILDQSLLSFLSFSEESLSWLNQILNYTWIQQFPILSRIKLFKWIVLNICIRLGVFQAMKVLNLFTSFMFDLSFELGSVLFWLLSNSLQDLVGIDRTIIYWLGNDWNEVVPFV